MSTEDIEKRRAYQRKADAKWYAKNKAKRNDGNRLCRKKLRQMLQSIKVSNGCADCGQMHPACLSFHHLDPASKIYVMGNVKVGKKKLLEEASKCIVLCENCHRIRHWNERNPQP